jgi:hypothetical protein
MSDALSKAASREAWAAWLRAWWVQAPPWRPRQWRPRQWPPLHWPPRRALHWTPRVALIAVVCAFLFAWGFLRIVLMLIFAPASS